MAATHPYNYSIHAIPAAYLLALAPAYYSFIRLQLSTSFTATNITPRTNLDTFSPGPNKSSSLKSPISSALHNHLLRARGAHLNALEGLPLFAAAMLAGNMAKLDTGELNSAAKWYLLSRVLYTGLYLGVRSEIGSYARSAVFAAGLVGVPVWVLVKAGRGVAEGGLKL